MAQDGDIYGIGQEKLDYVQGNLGTKNPQAMRFSQGLGIRVLAGAEGLGLRCRSGRLIACVPLARIRPSVRGFGVDVETAHREKGRGDVARFLPQIRKQAVLIWCFEKFRRSKHPINLFSKGHKRDKLYLLS